MRQNKITTENGGHGENATIAELSDGGKIGLLMNFNAVVLKDGIRRIVH
jgi:hypothetical protein